MSITKFTNSVSSRVAASAVGITMALALLGSAAPAQAAALTASQVNAIVSLLQSFGADAATIANVQASLNGMPTTTTTTMTSSTSCTSTWARSLTVGSTGADVMALQKFLNANGAMVSASGAGSMGMETMYFGPATRAAVAKYQMAHGISPAVGYFGPLTRASVNSMCTTSTTGGTTTTTGGTTTTTTGASGISTPGIPGTLAMSIWTSPSDGTTVYKGQSYDIVAYKVQASASDMAVNSVSLDFDFRPWLYADTITLKDDQGHTVATMNNLSQSNFTELTVGSDYRITIPVSNYVVKAAQTRYLTVNMSFLPTSDRDSATIHVTQAQIRSVDGTGVNDTETTASSRSFSYNGSSAGQVVVTTDATSPQSGTVQISTSGQTQGVNLAVYSLKSQTAPGTLRSVSLVVNTTGTGSSNKTPEQLFANYKLKIGSNTYGANTITPNSTVGNAASTTITFNNFSEMLPADTYVPLTLMADVQQDTSNVLDGAIASTTLAAAGSAGGTTNNPDVEDTSFNTLDVNDVTLTSNNLTFTNSSVTAGNLALTYGNLGQNTSNGSTTQQVTFTYNLVAGNNPIYVSKTQGTALTTSVTGTSGFYATAVNFFDNDTSNDTSTYFYIAPGQTKSFTAIYSTNGPSGSSGTLKVASLNYSTSSTLSPSSSLNYATITNTLQATLFH